LEHESIIIVAACNVMVAVPIHLCSWWFNQNFTARAPPDQTHHYHSQRRRLLRRFVLQQLAAPASIAVLFPDRDDASAPALLASKGLPEASKAAFRCASVRSPHIVRCGAITMHRAFAGQLACLPACEQMGRWMSWSACRAWVTVRALIGHSASKLLGGR
jgi:hypothetical protein